MVEVARPALEDALANLRQSVKKSTPDPLVGIFKGDTLNLYQEGYLSVWENVSLSGESEEKFFAVDGDDFYNVVSRLSSDTVDLKMNEKSITVKGGRSNVRLQFVDSFSNLIPQEPSGDLVEVPSDFFNSFLVARRFIAKSEHQVNLTCIYFNKSDIGVYIMATDGIKLFYREFELDSAYSFNLDVMLPDSCVEPLSKIFSSTGTRVGLNKKGHVIIDTDYGAKALTTSFNGVFPHTKIRPLVKEQGNLLFRCDKKDFMDSIRLGDNISDGDRITLSNGDIGSVAESISINFTDSRMESDIYLETAKDISEFDNVTLASDLLIQCLAPLGDEIEVRQQKNGMLWMTTDGSTITLLHKIAV